MRGSQRPASGLQTSVRSTGDGVGYTEFHRRVGSPGGHAARKIARTATALARWLGEHAEESGAAAVLDLRRDEDARAMLDRRWRTAGLSADELRRHLERVLGTGEPRVDLACAGLEGSADPLELLKAMARSRPVLVLAHDAPTSHDAVRRVAEVAVVVAAGPLGQTADAAIRLGPLPPEEEQALYATRLRLEPALSQRLAGISRGVPRFAVQLLTELVARDALVPGPAGHRLRSEGIRLPATLDELYRDRVETLALQLPRALRPALALAATGRTDAARFLDLARAAGIPDADRALRALLESGLVEGTSARSISSTGGSRPSWSQQRTPRELPPERATHCDSSSTARTRATSPRSSRGARRGSLRADREGLLVRRDGSRVVVAVSIGASRPASASAHDHDRRARGPHRTRRHRGATVPRVASG